MNSISAAGKYTQANEFIQIAMPRRYSISGRQAKYTQKPRQTASEVANHKKHKNIRIGAHFYAILYNLQNKFTGNL